MKYKIITPEMRSVKKIWYQRARKELQAAYHTFIFESIKKGMIEDEWDLIAHEINAIKKNGGIFIIPKNQTESGQEEKYLIFNNGKKLQKIKRHPGKKKNI